MPSSGSTRGCAPVADVDAKYGRRVEGFYGAGVKTGVEAPRRHVQDCSPVTLTTVLLAVGWTRRPRGRTCARCSACCCPCTTTDGERTPGSHVSSSPPGTAPDVRVRQPSAHRRTGQSRCLLVAVSKGVCG